MEGYGGRGWETSSTPDCQRRGLYTFRIRTAPFAPGVTFDSPDPYEICTRRARSNTPLQALTLLNDPVFFEMAQALADHALSEPDLNQDDRVEYAFRLCLARMPTEGELKQLAAYLQARLNKFQSIEDFSSWMLPVT